MSLTLEHAHIAEAGIEMCSVRVGETLFGVPITKILEILGAPATRPVPLAPSFVGGLVHYRGEVLPAVSLRSLLGLGDSPERQDMLVFRGTDGYFGLLVDAVGEVLTVHPRDYETNPSTLDDRRKALFAGTYKLADRLLVMLDPDLLDPMRLVR
ncbi:chemotaxis protein CheW [Silvibacterium acidisoli]|uniref:chemotaxis protein CheW n=1 Tax=Acidobacteriaceae bacterium ZG23-2 TaxID=2883246 RepID=UPI00406C1CEB